MTRNRHAEENRARPGVTPTKVRCLVELLRRRSTRRKLVLLECGVIRLAPFADCGRTIWEWLPTTPWFRAQVPPAAAIRASRGEREWPEPGELPEPYLTPLDGHQAVERLEDHVDGLTSDDQLVQAEEYLSRAEWYAEADRFETPEDRRVELETNYGVADWLSRLGRFGPDWRNTLDYYLANYSGQNYRWGDYRALHPGHHAVAMSLIHDIFGNPLRPVTLAPGWPASAAVGLATRMYDARDFSALPVLADALEDAGCDSADVLAHCRGPGPHVRGCWVVDLVLGKT